ncbi:MAG: hypothetical protein ABSG59_18110 [Verrucomicrobiota bacterium]|jgi:hypothetical protein
MNTQLARKRRLLLGFLFLATGSVVGQGQMTSSTPLNSSDAAEYVCVQRGPHSRVWQSTVLQTNAAGIVFTDVHSYTELRSGLCYLTNGEYADSVEMIDLTATGAQAAQGAHKVSWAASANAPGGAVRLTTPAGQQFSSGVFGLCYWDAAAGTNVLIAPVQNSLGLVVGANQVIYTNAFAGLNADIETTYTLDGFQQNIVLREQPPPPSDYGLNPATTFLNVITRFLRAPAPQITTVQTDGVNDDVLLDFGDMAMGQGTAFLTSETSNGPQQVDVSKQWVPLNDGTVALTESAPYTAISNLLQTLPLHSSISKPARNVRRTASLKSLLEQRAARPSPSGQIRVARAIPERPGFVIDYSLVIGSLTNYIFRGDTTYYISGALTLYGTNTFEGGAVLKYANGASITEAAYPQNPNLLFVNGPFRPVLFTAKDDNSVGNTIAGSTGNPVNYYANPALNAQVVSLAMTNVRVSYASQAISMAPSAPSIVDSQFINCSNGISVSSGSRVTVMNTLFANVCCPFNNIQSAGDTINGENLTFNMSKYIANIAPGGTTGLSVNFTNCIFSRVTNLANQTFSFNGSYNGFYSSPSFGGNIITNTSYPFQTFGAGAYYLAAGSTNGNSGTTNINSTWLVDLQSRTTYPPLWLTNTFTTNLVLVPQVPRDNAGAHVALGYHYAPIDYLAACSVSNATMLLTNGVVLAYYDNAGIWLQDGSALLSQGTPNLPNVLAYYSLVQEEPIPLWNVTNALAQSQAINPAPFGTGANPAIGLRFTFLYSAPGAGFVLNTADAGQVLGSLSLRDCQVYGAGAAWQMTETNNSPAVSLCNNLFHRTPFAIDSAAQVSLENNLFYGTTNASVTNLTVSIHYRGATSPNSSVNNAFNGSAVSLDGTVGYNAYLNGATNGSYQSGDILTNLTWVAGPLGSFYQPTNSPLINNGSALASQFGLQDYTVTANNVVDGNVQVSIGLHYVAVGANGLPLETDGYGIPNYLGDQSVLPDWWQLEYFGAVAINPNADYDGTGMTVLQDYQGGLNPNVIAFSIGPANGCFNSNALVQLNVSSGIPFFMASLVDSTNYSQARWLPFSTNLAVNLGSVAGWHTVSVGVRGLPPDAQQSWAQTRFKLVVTPPTLVITNPIPGTVVAPVIQLQGYSLEDLASLSYDLSNSTTLCTDQPGYITSRQFDTNAFEYTTDWFQCFNVPLANATNIITLQALDLAGNVTITNLIYVLNPAANTNPPVMTLAWPQNNAPISGTNFTIRGLVNDPFATVTAAIVDDGATNVLTGSVEQNGSFWIENVPLNAGTNYLTIAATNTAGYGIATNIAVTQSDVVLTINSVSSMNSGPTAAVTGTVSPGTETVFVNGVQATNNGNGTWTAQYVPSSVNGTATFSASASPDGLSSSANAQSEANVPGPYGLLPTAFSYDLSAQRTVNAYDGYTNGANTEMTMHWQFDAPGSEYESISGFWSGQTFYVPFDDVWHCTWGINDIGEYSSSWLGETNTPPPSPTNNGLWDPSSMPVLSFLDGVFGYENANGAGLGTVGGQQETFAYQYQIQTKWTLYTGGRSDSLQQNLWIVSMSLEGETAFNLPPPGGVVDGYSVGDGYWTLPANVGLGFIPPGQITIAGQTLDAYDSVYLTFPNNAAVELAMNAPGNYIGGGGAREYSITTQTECGAPSNPDTSRTTIGIGEQVICSITPSPPPYLPYSVNWSVAGGGTISATNGSTIVFTASMSPSQPTVYAQYGPAQPFSITFKVIAPTGIGNVSVRDNIGWGAPGVNGIGAFTIFSGNILPTTVAFANVQKRENIPQNVHRWPNGLQSGTLAQTLPITNSPCETTTTDRVYDGSFPVARLFNGTNFVDFSYTTTWQDQYLDANSNWVTFANLSTLTEFRGSDQACRETYQGVPGSWQGPWENVTTSQ